MRETGDVLGGLIASSTIVRIHYKFEELKFLMFKVFTSIVGWWLPWWFSLNALHKAFDNVVIVPLNVWKQIMVLWVSQNRGFLRTICLILITFDWDLNTHFFFLLFSYTFFDRRKTIFIWFSFHAISFAHPNTLMELFSFYSLSFLFSRHIKEPNSAKVKTNCFW